MRVGIRSSFRRGARRRLGRFEEVTLPDTWLLAGGIAQTIWNLGPGQPAEFGLKDVDLIYFDELNLSFEREASYERRLQVSRKTQTPAPLRIGPGNPRCCNLGHRDKHRVGSSATSRRCPRAVGSALGDRPSSEPLLGAHRDAAGAAFRDGWR